jgi:hypothetical protein
MLPPGAGSGDDSIDALLPPGATPGSTAGKTAGGKKKLRATVTIETGDGDYVTLEEPVKKVGSRELHTLSPEEKASRRFMTNLIVVGICAVILVGSLAVLLITRG